jgi:hypothetical protein
MSVTIDAPAKQPKPTRAEAHAQLLAGVSESPPLLASRAEAARLLGGVHVSLPAKLARQGLLERVFIGRRSMFTIASIRALASAPKADAGDY